MDEKDKRIQELTAKLNTIRKQVETAIEQTCDKYCKYPQEYLARYKDPDDAAAMLDTEVCRDCPLCSLFWR